MKPYSENPADAHGCKYARKQKKIHARQVAERIHKKRARRVAAKELNNIDQ